MEIEKKKLIDLIKASLDKDSQNLVQFFDTNKSVDQIIEDLENENIINLSLEESDDQQDN